MGAIFLSYARRDRACAEKLAQVLEGAGHDVWWDRRLDGGEEFSAEIEAALDKSDVVLVAWSRESVKSRWVRDEAAAGGDSGQLVPVSIDGSMPPMGFRQFHTLDLTGWKGGKRDARTAELIQSVERRLQTKGGGPAPAPRPAGSGRGFAMPTGKGLWAVLLILVLGALGAGMYFLEFRPSGDRTTKPTIALVTFSAPASDPQLRDLVGQVRDSLSHKLPQSGVPVRIFDTMPAVKSGAGDFMLFGDLSRNAAKIVATVRLEEMTRGVTVFSNRIEATPQEMPDFADRIGAQMAAMLSGGSTLLLLDRRHPIEPTLLTDLLAAEGSGDLLQHYQSAKRVAAKAPDIAGAQIGVAFYTGFILDQLPQGERSRALDEARKAYDAGLRLAPEFGDTYAAWCNLHSDARLVECEDHLRTGDRIDPDAPFLNGFLAGLLRSVGRFDEAFERSKLSYTHDPYNNLKIGELLRALETTGDTDEAKELYRNGARWWPDEKAGFFRSRIFGLVTVGNFERMRQVEDEVGEDARSPRYTLTAPIASAVRSRSVPQLRRVCQEPEASFILVIRCMIAFSALNDLDGAYAIADKIYPARIGRNQAQTEQIWLNDPFGAAPLEFIASPAAKTMRRDLRYLSLAQRTGLLAYWRSGRIPDFCRKDPEPICSQLLARASRR